MRNTGNDHDRIEKCIQVCHRSWMIVAIHQDGFLNQGVKKPVLSSLRTW
jgi:hypothetical protein